MVSVINRCLEKQWINPPSWVNDNNILEVLTGSISYGMNNDLSDMDIVSVVLPPKADLFPYSIGGHVFNFGTKPQPFTVYQKHHIIDDEKSREYDITIYSIVKFFQLCMENNPNILDIIASPRRCILHTTEIGERIIKNKKMFYHKGSFHKFIGYAYASLSKIKSKENPTNSKRAELVEKFGYDVKYMAHLVRLTLECQQILAEGDLDIERNTAILRSVRNGEWTLEHGIDWFANMEKSLNTLYATSTLRHEPDENMIKKLLLECLEIQYGSLSSAIQINPDMETMLGDFKNLIFKYEAK